MNEIIPVMLYKAEFKNDRFKTENQDQSKLIVDIKSSNLSERTKQCIQIVAQKVYSETCIESTVNYDDLCGPWIYTKNPVYDRYFASPIPKLCIWKYFTKGDLIYMKKYQMSKKDICFLFENKFLNENKDKNMKICVKMLWEFFKFMRFHSFDEKRISAVLGIIYLTHLLLLSHPRWTAQEVYQFFYKAVLFHVVDNPPKSLEVFTINEIQFLLKAFHKICIGNLVLLHILCHPNYHFTLDLYNLIQKN